MGYSAAVTKKAPFGIRFEPEEQDALERAAKADKRAASAMGRKIITDWLESHGFLGEGPKLGPKASADV
jgi:hypothetical protein